MFELSIKEKAVLFGIDLSAGDDGNSLNEAEISLSELERLADTAGVETAAKVIQKRKAPNVSTYIGIGKIEEIAAFCKLNEISLIICDDELTGSQIKNIEDLLDIKVIDRTMLILDIFASRAQSAEGRLQVELAQLRYRLPRLQGFGNDLSRLGGGIGTRGPGESKLETDRRHIRRKIKFLEDALEEVAKRRELSRKKRQKDSIPTIALVGYTNAGKSSLMNALCGSEVFVEDKLFATLDTTIRKIQTDSGEDILLIDTVGFIRKLPHTLIDAFKSTLEESLNADLILQVVDSSDPEAENHIKITETLLSELGAGEKTMFTVFNKSDLIPVIDPSVTTHSVSELSSTQELKKIPVYTVSAKTGAGLSELLEACKKYFGIKKSFTLLIPYTDGKIIDNLYKNHKITESEHKEDGVVIKVLLDESAEKQYAKYIIK
jgi:GTP-binding protein HflX